MGCRRKGASTGGPDHLVGRVAHGAIEQRLASGLVGRCFVLWAALFGAESDFDDLRGDLAVRLGWQEPCGLDISGFLDQTCDAITNCGLSWAELRELAVDVFKNRYENDVVEVECYDPRTWEQAVNDSLFSGGSCKACELGIGGSAKEHRDIAGWVLHRRTTWDQIEKRVHALNAPKA